MKARRPTKKPAAKRRHAAAAGERAVHCDSLIAAIRELEQALVATANGGPGTRIRRALGKVARQVDEHVRLTEGEHGLLSMVDEKCPHLLRWSARLRAEHAQLEKAIARLTARADRAQAAGWKRAQLAGVRRGADDLLGALLKHQAEGTELMFEAFVSDLGAPAD